MTGGEHEFLAPGHPVEPVSQRMTNEDFRKLMMTPRSTPGGSSSAPNPAVARLEADKTPLRGADPDKAEKRRKKRSYYAKLKKDEDDKMAELAAKYRDRAAERRDGGEGGLAPDDASSAGYRAVAPDMRQSHDAAERRRQMIQESKYLGGDMEHTHLVKGLDFALLQKVRSEIVHREAEAEEEQNEEEDGEEKDAKDSKEGKKENKEEKKEAEKKTAEEELKIECRTILAKNVVRTVFNPDSHRVHELFLPGRMAYVMELEEEGETDIPTTTIRSKKDVAQQEQKATLSTNDIVINKLTQILSYLRAGARSKKKKKDKAGGGMEAPIHVKGDDVPIYDDLKEYNKPIKKEKDDRSHRRDDYRDRRDKDDDRRRDRDRKDRDRRDRDRRDRDKRDRGGTRWGEDREREEKGAVGGYFDKPIEEEEDKEHRGGFSASDKQMIKTLIKREDDKTKQKDEKKLAGLMGASQPEGYAECYPGLDEMVDAIDDSDDEADYSKMDMGNKKGPVGRWDFDTAEEYADYMGSKEAMPKAAFQYGMKMSDGRKTRGKIGQKNEKAKLDKEWNQISALIDKRKSGSGGGSSNKKPKYD